MVVHFKQQKCDSLGLVFKHSLAVCEVSLCLSLPLSAPPCPSLPLSAPLCPSLPLSAPLCPSLPFSCSPLAPGCYFLARRALLMRSLRCFRAAHPRSTTAVRLPSRTERIQLGAFVTEPAAGMPRSPSRLRPSTLDSRTRAYRRTLLAGWPRLIRCALGPDGLFARLVMGLLLLLQQLPRTWVPPNSSASEPRNH